MSYSIYHPPKPSPNNPVILYLPRGPLGIPKPNPVSSLALSSNAIIVNVGYRLSAQHPYPTPIHDVLASYDWVKKHLGRVTDSGRGIYVDTSLRKLGVCGEYIGGSLATMLALTECHVDQHSIKAAVIGNPILDWTSLFSENPSPAVAQTSLLHGRDSSMTGLKLDSRRNELTIESLISLRDRIFYRPEMFFDPFASPALFFRTPAYDLPVEINSLLIEASHEANQPQPVIRKRRSHRKYPPISFKLRLPRMRVELGEEWILKDQGLDMVDLMRRGVNLWETEECQKGEYQDGDDRIELVEKGGMGLWGESQMDAIGRWFADALGQS